MTLLSPATARLMERLAQAEQIAPAQVAGAGLARAQRNQTRLAQVQPLHIGQGQPAIGQPQRREERVVLPEDAVGCQVEQIGGGGQLAEARVRLTGYRQVLQQRYGARLRLRSYAVVSLGFDRLAWDEV